MIQITDKTNCCGCEACAQVCPKACISMERDAEGFLYPHANLDICINCGLCEKVCPCLNGEEAKEPMAVYAAINPDEEVRRKSSSGGVFTLLAEQIISKGGVVFGARFDDNWQVEIVGAETMEQVATFRGSKYLQAKVGDSYKQCKAFLDAGREVLYSGTPCQIAGLLHYLRKRHANLSTVDFVCHGVPSPGVWKKYIEEVATAGKQAIREVSFRNKAKGWKRFSFYMNYDSDNNIVTMLSPLDKNPYMQAFLSDLILRPSCHDCPAKGGKSHSDITIADFWGIQNILPSMDDDKGTSLVLINTEKGEKVFPEDNLRCEATTMDALRYNSAYNNSSRPNPKRDTFFTELSEDANIHNLIEKALQPSFEQQMKSLVKYPILQAKKVMKALLHKGSENPTGGGKFIENQQFVLYNTNIETSSIAFRDKRNGWKHYVLRIELKATDGQ